MNNEDFRRVILSPKDRRMLTGLGNVAQDLWGECPSQQDEKPVSLQEKSSILSPEKLWSVADEPVDWTDALVYSSSPDGLTSAEDWDYYRSKAQGVLSGNMDDYVDVLNRAKPLDDIVPYADSLEIAVVSPDLLRVGFSPKQGYESAAGNDAGKYIAGVSIRIARDLLALLPVTDVEVTCRMADTRNTELLRINFNRNMLRNVRFSFINPEDFVKSCGGNFGKML